MGKICFLFVFSVGTVACYPLNDLNAEYKPELKDELHFPNGTVVGKYTYMDNDGNPVEVKYYAGDSSYGVELKSVKTIDTNSEEPPWMSERFDTTESAFKDVSNILNLNPVLGNKYKIGPSNPNKESAKINHYKTDKTNPEFEILYKNELKSKECGKDKVRIYLDKNENRKVRNTINDVDVDKYCEQF